MFTGLKERAKAYSSFKPNLLRYTKAMAGKACHGFGSTTQVGLTQGVRRHNQASMDSTLLTGIIGAIATIGAVVLGWYLQRPKTESPKAPSPVSPEEDASKAYARRYLEYPSHYRFIKALDRKSTRLNSSH